MEGSDVTGMVAGGGTVAFVSDLTMVSGSEEDIIGATGADCGTTFSFLIVIGMSVVAETGMGIPISGNGAADLAGLCGVDRALAVGGLTGGVNS
jgi:hypothetical protein